jgi:MoaA/NifB/PqqE/SkfB family radical SAM enzyme
MFYPVNKIYIEISGRCNANCNYCIQKRLRENGFYGHYMDVETFEKTIRHLKEIGINNQKRNIIALYNWGEPFLNPYFNEILGVLKENNLFAEISSNFGYVPDISLDLLGVIKEITVSLSGFSQLSYSTFPAKIPKQSLYE